MRLVRADLSRMVKRRIVLVLWAAPADLWVFYSGVVAGLGANVFATRALSRGTCRSPRWMWLELTVFLASSAFGVAVGAVRRRVEERWREGGGHPGHEEIFLEYEIRKLTFYVVSVILLLVAGLLMVLGG